MGLFDWVSRLLGGKPAETHTRSQTNRPATPQPTSSTWRRPKERPAVVLTGLDVGKFAPLTSDEVKKKARGLGSLWGHPWFGRRDLIPPVTDPRTQLIDRAMVGHGLLTPEELVEIHRVGEQMDIVRPDLAMASQIATQEVARSEQERAERKLQKKAEAAERRRLRAEAIAERRRTDIIFLGRGVSGGLANRQSDTEKLALAVLPILSTPGELAEALGITIPRLRWLAFHTETAERTHYIRFRVPKKSGGTRELASPHRSLAACQEWILRNVLDHVAVHSAAQGFVVGRSTLTNAKPHVGKEVLINCDLKDFFPTITFPRVKGTFQKLGYSPAVATILALLCTECPRREMTYAGKTYQVAEGPRALPQGACTSPAISNLVTRRLDARFTGLAAKLGYAYTRYADDLTFSCSGEAGQKIGYLLARVRHIVEQEGFVVNPKKTRVQRQNAQQNVTGIVVNDRPGVPRDVIRRVRSILHHARYEGLASQNRDDVPHFNAWLRGMIAYISMVNPDQGRSLKLAYDALGSM